MTKRTYQPKKLHAQKEHGFRKRMSQERPQGSGSPPRKGQKEAELLISSM